MGASPRPVGDRRHATLRLAVPTDGVAGLEALLARSTGCAAPGKVGSDLPNIPS